MSQLKVDSLADTAGAASVPIEDVINGTCRAWVNFNGTGTVAIRADYNVSSITDNGTGDYTVNFTSAMPDVNYAAITSGVSATSTTNTTGPKVGTDLDSALVTYSTTALRLYALRGSGTPNDPTAICVIILR